MMRKILITLIAFCLITPANGQASQSKDLEDQITRVENGLSGRVLIDGKTWNVLDRMAHFNVKGLSLAVVQDYKIVWAKGYGWANENPKVPVTTKTLFKPGSLSKSINALGVLTLAANKKVALYDDINLHLRSWKFPYDSISKGRKITLANLLSHTGGLSVYGGFPGYSNKTLIPTLPQVLDGTPPANTPAVRSLFEPGVSFQYSGGGVLISQLIIADVTGQTYETYMYKNVLKPLGMFDSFYSETPPAGARMKNIAVGYSTDGNPVKSNSYTYPEQAAMGLWTTPAEICKYLVETQLGYVGKSKVVTQDIAKLLLTPYIDQSATMGNFIGDRNGEKYFFHDAANDGFRGLFYGSVEGGNGVAVFVNSDDGNIILELLASVANTYHWKGFEKPPTVTTKQITETRAQKYSGNYLYDGMIASVRKKDDGLYFWSNGQEAKMYFTSDTDFINLEFLAEKTFTLNDFGDVTGYSRHVNGKTFPPAKKILTTDTLKANEGQLNMFGRHLIEIKQFREAMVYLHRAKQVESDTSDVIKNLAHGYLFSHDYDRAIRLYENYLSRKDKGSAVLALKTDFDFFKRNGFENDVINQAIRQLEID